MLRRPRLDSVSDSDDSVFATSTSDPYNLLSESRQDLRKTALLQSSVQHSDRRMTDEGYEKKVISSSLHCEAMDLCADKEPLNLRNLVSSTTDISLQGLDTLSDVTEGSCEPKEIVHTTKASEVEFSDREECFNERQRERRSCIIAQASEDDTPHLDVTPGSRSAMCRQIQGLTSGKASEEQVSWSAAGGSRTIYDSIEIQREQVSVSPELPALTYSRVTFSPSSDSETEVRPHKAARKRSFVCVDKSPLFKGQHRSRPRTKGSTGVTGVFQNVSLGDEHRLKRKMCMTSTLSRGDKMSGDSVVLSDSYYDEPQAGDVKLLSSPSEQDKNSYTVGSPAASPVDIEECGRTGEGVGGHGSREHCLVSTGLRNMVKSGGSSDSCPSELDVSMHSLSLEDSCGSEKVGCIVEGCSPQPSEDSDKENEPQPSSPLKYTTYIHPHTPKTRPTNSMLKLGKPLHTPVSTRR